MSIRSQDFESPELKSRPASHEVQSLIDEGRLAYDRENYQLAVAKVSAALRKSPKSVDALYQRGLVYFAQEHFRAAIADCDTGLSLDRRNARFWFLRGDCQARLKEFEQAKADVLLGLKLEPKSLFGWDLLGFCHVELHEFEQAVDALSRAIRLNAQHAPAWYKRGRANFYLDEDSAAERDLTRAIELDPDSIGAFEYRARLRILSGQYEKAVKDLDRVVTKLPGWHAARAYRAEALVELAGRADEALDDANLAIQSNPDWVHGLHVRAQVLFRKEDYAKALIDLDRAIELAGGQPDDLFQFRGQVLMFEGMYPQAEHDLKQALLIHPENATTLCWMAQLHYEQRRNAEALAASEACLALQPDDADAIELRALSNEKLKNRTSALADVERLFRLKGDDDADVYVVRGDCYYFLGDYPAAYKNYERAMDLDAESADIVNEYAYALASCPDPNQRRAKLALTLCDKALTLAENPNSSDAWWFRDTQAIALAADGQFDRAVALLDEVLSHITNPAMRQESLDRRELFRQRQPFVAV